MLLDGRGRVAETVARRKRYQGEPGSGGTYRHNPICDAHDAKTSSAIGPLPRAARVRDSDSPDDVDADVEEGHEEPEALVREQFSNMLRGLQVGS